MTADVYRRLARYLDSLPAGFPPTESGVELRILRRLFTPEEAELFLPLTLIPAEAPVIARRVGRPVDGVADLLAGMAKRGLCLAYYPEGKLVQYAAAQWVIGLYEFQVDKLTPELVQDVEEYFPLWWDHETWKRAPQLRTIPVGESIDPQLEVMPYERAEALVRAQTSLLVAPCVCRQEQEVAGHPCAKPRETCLIFGIGAEYYVRNGVGRRIDQEEALAILRQAEEAGLVLQPGNARDTQGICACCGCCCGVLRAIKRHPQPATLVSTPFRAALDQATCEGCGACLDRCQMEALRLDDGLAALALDRCIGCGLCVPTCPTGSLRLERKPEAEQPYVPKNIVEFTIRLAQTRGPLAVGRLAKMQARSKIDRLLTPRSPGEG